MMFDNTAKEEMDGIRRKIGFVRRFIAKYLVLFLHSLFIYYLPLSSRNDSYMVYFGYQDPASVALQRDCIIGVILVFLMYYSMMRLMTVYNEEMTNNFLESETKIQTFGQKLRFIFGHTETKIEIPILLALLIIVPHNVYAPSLTQLLAGNVGDNGFLVKLKVLAIVIPVMIAIYVFAYFKAITFWDKEERKKLIKYQDLSKRQIAIEEKKDRRTYRRTYITLLVGYFVGGYVAVVYIPALAVSLWPTIKFIANGYVLTVVLLLIFAPIVYRYIRALKKRRSFIKRLKKLCKDKKYRISKIRYPYMSIFTAYNGESFTVTYRDKKYSCKVISSKKVGSPLYIHNGGIASYLVKFSFLRVEMFSYTKSFRFGWEADCKKIVILNPTPKKVLLADKYKSSNTENGKYDFESERSFVIPKNRTVMTYGNNNMEIDHGDIVDGYEFYTATTFLNALERDVIDRD